MEYIGIGGLFLLLGQPSPSCQSLSLQELPLLVHFLLSIRAVELREYLGKGNAPPYTTELNREAIRGVIGILSEYRDG